MTNPLLEFSGKDVVTIYAAAYALTGLGLTVVWSVLWGLAHFGVWR
jgi:hypothetical protein